MLRCDIRDKNSCIKTSDIDCDYKIWWNNSIALSLRRVKLLKDKTMKTILYILFAATMMVGCNNSKATTGFDSVDATRFAEVIENEQVTLIGLPTMALPKMRVERKFSLVFFVKRENISTFAIQKELFEVMQNAEDQNTLYIANS